MIGMLFRVESSKQPLCWLKKEVYPKRACPFTLLRLEFYKTKSMRTFHSGVKTKTKNANTNEPIFQKCCLHSKGLKISKSYVPPEGFYKSL